MGTPGTTSISRCWGVASQAWRDITSVAVVTGDVHFLTCVFFSSWLILAGPEKDSHEVGVEVYMSGKCEGSVYSVTVARYLRLCLTGVLLVLHQVIRHLADYVLIWAGSGFHRNKRRADVCLLLLLGKGGDDVAKSPHMARIANSAACPSWEHYALHNLCHQSQYQYHTERRPQQCDFWFALLCFVTPGIPQCLPGRLHVHSLPPEPDNQGAH